MTDKKEIYKCLVDIVSRLRHLERGALEAGKKALQKKLGAQADALEAESRRIAKVLHKDWTKGAAAVQRGLMKAQAELRITLKAADKDDKVFRNAARLAAAAARALALAKKVL